VAAPAAPISELFAQAVKLGAFPDKTGAFPDKTGRADR
jgi:hypothetical protein